MKKLPDEKDTLLPCICGTRARPVVEIPIFHMKDHPTAVRIDCPAKNCMVTIQGNSQTQAFAMWNRAMEVIE